MSIYFVYQFVINSKNCGGSLIFPLSFCQLHAKWQTSGMSFDFFPYGLWLTNILQLNDCCYTSVADYQYCTNEQQITRLVKEDLNGNGRNDRKLPLIYCYYYYYYYNTICMSPVTGISSRYFSWTSSDPYRSRFKLHIAVLSVLCVMFQV